MSEQVAHKGGGVSGGWRAQLGALSAWKSALLAGALGALGALGQAPFVVSGEPLSIWPASAVMVFGWVLLLDGAHERAVSQGMAWRAGAWRVAAWRSWWMGFGYFAAGMWWVGSAFVSRGADLAPLAPLGVVALAGGLALFWAGAGGAALRFWTGDHRRIGVFAVAFCAFEYSRGFMFSGLPWNVLGYVWPAGGAMSQVAAHIGVWGLTAITVYAFAAPAALLSRGGTPVTRLLPIALGFAALSVTFASGLGRLTKAEVAYVDGVALRLVQLDLSMERKFTTDPYALLNEYLWASLSTADDAGGDDAGGEGDGLRPTHIIWPENAVPMFLLDQSPAMERINRAFGADQILLTGMLMREGRDDFDGRDPFLTPPLDGENDGGGRDFDLYYNTLAAFSFDRGAPYLEAIYRKSKLVPFGEYAPLQGVLQGVGFGPALSRVGFFQPGEGAATLDVPSVPRDSVPLTPRFAPHICYESVFPGFTPRAGDRPEWIVSVSNDAWFGRTPGPWQFLNMTRYRAIEEGLPIARTVIGGVSGVIDPYGRMPADFRAPFGDTAIIDAPLPSPLRPTYYSLWGDAPLVFLLYLGFVLARWRPGGVLG